MICNGHLALEGGEGKDLTQGGGGGSVNKTRRKGEGPKVVSYSRVGS